MEGHTVPLTLSMDIQCDFIELVLKEMSLSLNERASGQAKALKQTDIKALFWFLNNEWFDHRRKGKNNEAIDECDV